MSELWNAPAPPSVKPQFNQGRAMLAVVGVAVLMIDALNIFSASHPPRDALPSPSALKLQQLQATMPAPVDPNAFHEDRDGSNALSLEDENGKATIWQDTASGSRIFCLDSCTVLPTAHPHHHISKLLKP